MIRIRLMPLARIELIVGILRIIDLVGHREQVRVELSAGEVHGKRRVTRNNRHREQGPTSVDIDCFNVRANGSSRPLTVSTFVQHKSLLYARFIQAAIYFYIDRTISSS